MNGIGMRVKRLFIIKAGTRFVTQGVVGVQIESYALRIAQSGLRPLRIRLEHRRLHAGVRIRMGRHAGWWHVVGGKNAFDGI
jgi:hypothetical protein